MRNCVQERNFKAVTRVRRGLSHPHATKCNGLIHFQASLPLHTRSSRKVGPPHEEATPPVRTSATAGDLPMPEVGEATGVG